MKIANCKLQIANRCGLQYSPSRDVKPCSADRRSTNRKNQLCNFHFSICNFFNSHFSASASRQSHDRFFAELRPVQNAGDLSFVHDSDPIADADTVETELMLADLESLEKRVPNLIKKGQQGDKESKAAACV